MVYLIINAAKISQAKRVDIFCNTYPPVSIKTIVRATRSILGVTRVRIGGATRRFLDNSKSFCFWVKTRNIYIVGRVHVSTHDYAGSAVSSAACYFVFLRMGQNVISSSLIPELPC